VDTLSELLIIVTRAFVNLPTRPLLWSGSANGHLSQWNLDSIEDNTPLQQRRINMAKLNWIEAYSLDKDSASQRLIAAGVTGANEGAIHVYDASR
jgi:hypothetical protein